MNDARLGKLVKQLIIDEIREYLRELLNARSLKLRESDNEAHQEYLAQRAKVAKEKLQRMKNLKNHDKEVEKKDFQFLDLQFQ